MAGRLQLSHGPAVINGDLLHDTLLLFGVADLVTDLVQFELDRLFPVASLGGRAVDLPLQDHVCDLTVAPANLLLELLADGELDTLDRQVALTVVNLDIGLSLLLR